MSETLQTVMTVVIAHGLAVASPGPDFAVVLRQSIAHGRAPALWTALGIGLGIGVHVAYAVVGIGLLISQTPWLMAAIQLAGAAYLLWIARDALTAAPHSDAALDATGHTPATAWRSLRVGFVTNVLNPKATLFFLALFTAVISPDTPLAVQLGLGVWLCVATGAWFALVSVAFTTAAARRWFIARAHWIDRGMGVVLVVLAGHLIWSVLAPVIT